MQYYFRINLEHTLKQKKNILLIMTIGAIPKDFKDFANLSSS
jgi:hypothetical protein